MPRPTKQPAPAAPDYGDSATLPSDQRRRARRPLGQFPPFIFAWAEDAWEVSSGRIVPRILRYQVRDGMNGTGVVTDQSGRVLAVDPSLLRANLHGWGKHEIPHEVDGRGKSYMRQPYPGLYIDRWTTVYEGTDRVTFDQAGYDEWRESLVTRGMIPTARRPALEAMLAALESAHDNVIKRFGATLATAGASVEIEELKAQIKTLREAIANMADQSPGVEVPAGGTEATL